MTEAEWYGATDPQKMLEFLRGSKVSMRKMRLFAAACCGRINHLLSDKGSMAVIAAEGFADGLLSQEELHAAWAAVGYPKAPPRRYAASAARAASCSPGYDGTAHAAASAVNAAVCGAEGGVDGSETSEKAAQAALLRDILSNPFRPVPFNPVWGKWNDGAVSRIAQRIYDERAFDCLPVVADALLNAGCDNEELIQHCRREGPHVRGCWAIDLILAKD